MIWFVTKIIIAGVVIATSSWLAGQRPGLAGFLIALPISSILALSLNYVEYSDPEKAAAFARAICISVPLSLVFFVPFFVQKFTGFGFWVSFSTGIALLGVAYLVVDRVTGA